MCIVVFIFFLKQKTAYEMRISDGSSDVCSSDLVQRMPDRVVECVDMHCGSITPPAHRSGILVRTSHWKAPMTRTLISSGSPFERDVAYSRAVVDGDWVFVSGTTG